MSTFDDMVAFVMSANPARKFIVPCMEGPAGIGKTAAVKQAAADLASEGKATGKVVTIIASQILPNEVSGITMPVVESKAMEIFDHFRLSSLEDGDILFFDELLEADQLVLSACLTLIESRELMSGRKLPDCMIVAATNPSIKPTMLKENIRQRFVWRKFDLDKAGCREYIRKTCGFDPGKDVIDRLVTTGNEYNILTPRSLTKMCQWISSSSGDRKQVRFIASQIDAAWNCAIGSKIADAYMGKMNAPEMQVRNAIRSAILESCVTVHELEQIKPNAGDIIFSDEAFENADMTELMEILQQLPEWEAIERKLATTVMVEEDDEGTLSF